MIHLWVLRHAKAAALSPDGDDYGRPLTGRGRRQSSELERFLSGGGGGDLPRPELVLSSAARRAVETAGLVLPALGPLEMSVERALYEADVDDVVVRLHQAGEVSGVMVVGHNPTLQDLLLASVADTDEAGRRRVESGLPTAALAVIGFPGEWSQLDHRRGTLELLYVPEA